MLRMQNIKRHMTGTSSTPVFGQHKPSDHNAWDTTQLHCHNRALYLIGPVRQGVS
jgi:hypothetical protein